MDKGSKGSSNSDKNIEEYPPMFSISECKKLIPKIYDITEKYYNKVERLKLSRLNTTDLGEIKRYENLISKIMYKWKNEMEKYNLIVEGLWVVDFDSGDGIYYCWKYPERTLLYYHTIEEGFMGRRTITLLERNFIN